MTNPSVTMSWQFTASRLDLWGDDYCETVFEDGTACPASFTRRPDDLLLAGTLGYADVGRMHLEHELAHTFIAEALGWPWSKVLRRVALGEPWTFDTDRDFEENLVLAFQARLNGVGPDVAVRGHECGDLLVTFARRFRSCL